MFWKREKKPDRIRFQHYVPLALCTDLPALFEKAANSERCSEIRRDAVALWASEVFVMASMICACYPDAITGIFRQNQSDHEQTTELIRDGLARVIAARGREAETKLSVLASSFIEPVMAVLPKDSVATGLTAVMIEQSGSTFLFGCVFGHDHPKGYLRMLEESVREANKIGPNRFFKAGFLSIYHSLVEEADLSFLLDSGNLRSAYENGTLPERFVSIYRSMASRLVSSYESEFGSLRRV